MDDFDPIPDDNDDEPRPRRCPECRIYGGHVPGCPEADEQEDA
jgi:hypothetical protein